MQKVMSSLKKNAFFIYSSFLTYLVGAIISSFERNNIDFVGLILGILVFLTILAFQQLFNYLSASKINPYSRISFERGNKKAQLFILTIILFLIYLFLITTILRINKLIGVNLIYISLITILMLISITRLGKMAFQTSGILIEGLIVSPLMLLFGGGMQGMNPTYGHILLTLAFFFLYLATRTSLLFEQFERDQKIGERSVLDFIGWENVIKIHNVSLFLTYLVFFLYFYRNGSLTINLPVLITAIFGAFSIYLLNRMAIGMKPNWQIIKATAFLHFFAVCYLLIFPLF